MKKSALALAIAASVATLSGCDTGSPSQGQGLVYVKKPWMFGESGVVTKIETTGTYFFALTTNGVIVDLTQIEKDEKFTDLQTADRVPVDFEAPLQFRLRPEDGGRLIDKYGSITSWYNNVCRKVYRETVRQEARKISANDMMYNDTALSTLSDTIYKQMVAWVEKDLDAPITIVRVVVGKANAPEELQKEINETARQKQRVKTEREKDLAEKTRKIAEGSRAMADNEYQRKMDMTTDQYLRAKELDIQELAVKSGGNVQFIISSGAEITPVKSL